MAGPDEQQDGLAERLRAALGAITIDHDSQRPKQNYAFWGTQPVAQFGEQPGTSVRAAQYCVILPPPLCRLLLANITADRMHQ
jgi:hypothetical protein